MNIDDIKKKLEGDLEFAGGYKRAWQWEFSNLISQKESPCSHVLMGCCKSCDFEISREDADLITHSRNTYEANTRALLIAIKCLHEYASLELGKPSGTPYFAKHVLEQIAKELGVK